MKERMASALGVPPGSRVRTTDRPCSANRFASRRTWVDFPTPSPPSNVMKRGFIDRSSSVAIGVRQLSVVSDPAEGQLPKGVGRPAHDAAPVHRFGRIERRRLNDLVIAKYVELRKSVAGLDGWQNGGVIGDVGRKAPAVAARQVDVDAPLTHQTHLSLFAAIDTGVADDGVFGERRDALETACAPGDEFSGFLVALVDAGHAGQDANEPATAFGRGDDDAVSRRFRMACLEA